MKNLSLKLEEHIYSETEQIVGRLQKTRNRYINEALEFYNNYQKRRLLAEQLQKESLQIAADSMEVLREFEQLGYED
jgi:hypothetical protein